MNTKQRVILIVGFVLVLGMALFPPWVAVYDIPADKDRTFLRVRGRVERSAGYHLLFHQDNGQSMSSAVTVEGEYAEAYRSTRIDIVRLGVQVVSTLLLLGILWLVLKDRKKATSP